MKVAPENKIIRYSGKYNKTSIIHLEEITHIRGEYKVMQDIYSNELKNNVEFNTYCTTDQMKRVMISHTIAMGKPANQWSSFQGEEVDFETWIHAW